MTLTMNDVMKLGKLNECEVVAGHEGMNRVVKHITIIEVPEIAKWLKGNELLLTSLYSVRNDEEGQITLIQKLNASGASGLAIKPSQFVDEIPESMIKSANQLDFPIIKIPKNIKYLDLLTPVMNRLVNEKVVLQEDVTNATSLLEEVLINNKGIDVFKENLKIIIKKPVFIESELLINDRVGKDYLEPLSPEQIFELTLIKRPLKILRNFKGEKIFCIVAPVILEGEYYGNISSWVNDESDLSMDIAILERAITLLSLEFLKIKAKIEVEHQYENDFVRELLYSENIKRKNIVEWGSHFKISNNSNSICLILNIRNKYSNETVNSKLKDINIYNKIKNLTPEVLIGHSRKGLCIICSGDCEDIVKVSQSYYKEIKRDIDDEFELKMGVGRPEKGIQGIQNSFEQAEKAMLLGNIVKKNNQYKIYEYDELGVFLLLDTLGFSQELESFYNNIMENLMEKDKNKELLRTLESYFDNDESLKITADSLFIHVNTLKYRMKKIETITNQNTNTSEGKLNLNLALKIHHMKNHDNYYGYE